jgi:hypothetical protein
VCDAIMVAHLVVISCLVWNTCAVSCVLNMLACAVALCYFHCFKLCKKRKVCVVQLNLGLSVLLQVLLHRLMLQSRICALDFGVALLSSKLGMLQIGIRGSSITGYVTIWY